MIISDLTIDVLKKYFVFDRTFDLSRYDINGMHQLHSELSKLKKESYFPNYRFIFLHYETEYYFYKQYPGLTLTNLQRILSNLDISNYFCLILSQQDVADKMKFLQKHETTDQTAIDSIKYQNFYWTDDYLSPMIEQDIKISSEKISQKYLCLNRNNRFHRRVFFTLLKDKKLIEHGAISYHNRDASPSISSYPSAADMHPNKNLCLLETSTHTRVNDRWLLHDEYIKQCVNSGVIETSFKNFKEYVDPSWPDNRKNHYTHSSLVQQCFLQVVSESVYNYPCSFLNEKSLKPILFKRPFVIVGPSGSIKNIQSLGFKTFDHWWDESYDQIEDNEKRMLAVIEIVDQICQKDVHILRDICNEMKEVLEYNFDFYINHFKQQQIDCLHKFCQNNLQPRYD